MDETMTVQDMQEQPKGGFFLGDQLQTSSWWSMLYLSTHSPHNKHTLNIAVLILKTYSAVKTYANL